MLKESKVVFATEYKFHPVRRFKFDWAILKDQQGNDVKIAVEFEGINSAKSRHTTLTGYTGDCDKYNLAVLHGWRVLRYTALNYKNIWADLQTLLKK